MRFLVGVVFILVGGCGGTCDTQCTGSGGVDCSLLNLPICTAEYGDHTPHAFCTRPCDSDDDCGADGLCVVWSFPRGQHRVCVSSDWTN